jgi:hypothetical protein
MRTLAIETSRGKSTTSAPMINPKTTVKATTFCGDHGFQRGLKI